MNYKYKYIVRKFLLFVLPLTLLWIGIISYNLNTEKNFIISDIVHQNELKDSNTEFLIDKYMEEIIENLKLVRDSDELINYIDSQNDASLYELTAMFSRVIKNKEDYDQIRFIDEAGFEIARVDNDEDIIVVPTSELQNKSDRYYFTQTKELAYDQIFISPLDLNIEKGEIELPYKAMVRFATPIYDGENVFKGILIINYKAEYFVQLLEEHESHQDLDEFWFYIVNRNGEFILHQDSKKNFSFMFKELENLNFEKINKDAWQIINASSNGEIESSDELITYYDVLSKTREKNSNYEEKWIAIHHMDISTLFSPNTLVKEILLPRHLFVFIFIFGFAIVLTLISEKLKKRDSQLEITEKIASSTNDGVVITDNMTNITYVNAAYEEITGYKSEEVIGMQPRDFKSGRQDKLFYTRMWQDIKENGIWEGVLWDKKKNGVLYPQKMRIIAVKDKNNRSVHHYISIFTDLSSNKQKLDSTEEINFKESDFLVPNEDMMFQLLKQSIEDEAFSFMVLYIAIENFNQLITSFSDFEIKSSEIFMELLKPLINKEDFVAQTGRNIFTVIIGMQHLKVSPESFVELIYKNLSKIISIDGRDLFFKTRIGVSFWPQDTNDLKKLLLNSIIALDWTLSRQASDIAFFSENMIHELNQENEIEGHLRKAIEKNELFMVYQPQVDLETGQVIGMEALIRWTNEKLGVIPPLVFIPIAERTNLIIEIGYWVIDRVCKDLNEMSKLGALKNIRCAVNLSSIQLQEGVFLDRLFEIIGDNNIQSEQLEFEITESLLLSNETKNIEILSELRKVGFTVAIDDFGTGYSSLSYLNRLPIDKIKIDRSFIKDYPQNDDGKLARILVNMAKSLGINLLAEGAETEEQIAFLREIGCEHIQGYYFSKPLDKSEFMNYLIDGNFF